MIDVSFDWLFKWDDWWEYVFKVSEALFPVANVSEIEQQSVEDERETANADLAAISTEMARRMSDEVDDALSDADPPESDQPPVCLCQSCL